MNIAIVGGREFNNYEQLKDFILDIVEENAQIFKRGILSIDKVVSGGARGTDSLGEKFADEFGIEKLIFPAEWKKYGKKAGFLRNVDIIKNCDICFCFWNGESHGTRHDIELCKEYNKICHICNYLKKEFVLDEKIKGENIYYV